MLQRLAQEEDSTKARMAADAHAHAMRMRVLEQELRLLTSHQQAQREKCELAAEARLGAEQQLRMVSEALPSLAGQKDKLRLLLEGLGLDVDAELD